MKKCSSCGAVSSDEETTCGVCGKSFPDFFGTTNNPAPLEPVRHWRLTGQGVLGLAPGILLLVIGIVEATVALTIPLNYQGCARGGCITVPANLILSLGAIVILISGAITIYKQRESLRQVEWKTDDQKRETEMK